MIAVLAILLITSPVVSGRKQENEVVKTVRESRLLMEFNFWENRDPLTLVSAHLVQSFV